MKKTLLFCLLAAGTGALLAQNAPLRLEKTIPLPGVKGKFDHFAFDESGNRLFAAATGNQSVEVIDLGTGKIAQSIAGLGKPHGLAWIDAHLFVADGGKAELGIYAGAPLKLVKSIKLAEDADDMVYDPATGLLYVGQGGTNAANPPAVSVIDTKDLARAKSLPQAAHPEALELDPAGDRIFANIADTGEVAVIDGKSREQTTKWPLDHETGNTPLAYDVADHLLIVGCRTPAKLLALNAETGKQVGEAASDAGADDLFYDPATHRAYLIAGSGSIDTYAVSADGKLTSLGVTKTVSGAKTGLLVPSQSTLYIGVPGTSGPAEIRVYSTK